VLNWRHYYELERPQERVHAVTRDMFALLEEYELDYAVQIPLVQATEAASQQVFDHLDLVRKDVKTLKIE
jgi:hypothetical protein